MCGIVGYIGFRRAGDLIVEGLRRLEYRGYDSSGVATLACDGRVEVMKAAGRLENLESILKTDFPDSSIGIGHTRWATHGAPSDRNAHPHLGGSDTLAVVHNGVIENYRTLKIRLEAEGYVFRSETDSEVIAHLIDSCLTRLTATLPRSADDSADLPRVMAVREAISQLRGTYGILVLFRDEADLIVAARLGSPLVIGGADGEYFIASDTSPLAGHATNIIRLADHEIAIIQRNNLRIIHRDSGRVEPLTMPLNLEVTDVTRGDFDHFMLKEIYDQPETIAAAMRGRLSREDATAIFGGLNLSATRLQSTRKILLTGCGTSWHAAMLGEYLIEQFARLPVEVEYASELRYRNPPLEEGTLLFALTQSGETADTLAALREVKRKGHPTLAICNVVGSTIANEADGGIYLHAGPEIGVASTKAFTSQCVILALLALHFGRLRHMSFEQGLEFIDHLESLPELVTQALESSESIRHIAEKYCDSNTFLYLGRQYNFPIALEGALKLKEISYIHAEGYPAAEMKHGPIALVDAFTPSIFLIPQGNVYEKVVVNLEEIKARGGPVIAVVTAGDSRIKELADDIIEIPEAPEFLQPIITAIPLQLLAYHIAVLRGCDIDKPRNLAKSVTVE